MAEGSETQAKSPSQSKTVKTLLLVWPLLLGMFMIMVGNGLQGTLIALRAELDGFSLSTIGVVMSLYYCGFLAGCYIVPRMIDSVGHIRVFAGFASMASTTILVQGLFVEPFTWSAVRFVSGVSFAGLYIVAESWLNDISTNKLRGRILSAYVFVTYAGVLGGQFLIKLAPVEGIALFVLISVLLSLSLLPVTLANKPSPGCEGVEKLPFRKLVKTSPFAVMSVIVSGFVSAGMLTLGPLYAKSLGMDLSGVALFMGAYVLGCALLPLLMGWASDYIERRKVVTVVAALGAVLGYLIIGGVDTWFILPLVFVFGGCGLSLYSISMAMMTDRLKQSQMTSATSSLVLINGMSACVAPILLGMMMQNMGSGVFFSFFAFVYLVLFIYGVFRVLTGPDYSVDDQGDFQAIPARAAPSFGQIAEDD